MTLLRRLALAACCASVFAAAPAMAEDLLFDLNNRSSYDIIEFYASPYDVQSWEDDILGADILVSGDSVEITIADGREQCEYDLRFVFSDGDVVDEPAVDLCETGSYTIRD